MKRRRGWEQKFIFISLALVLAVSIIGLTACGGDDDEDTPTPTKTTAATVVPPPAVKPPPATTTIPAAPPIPAGWSVAQREGTNVAFYHPSDWIIMLDQKAPVLIVALDPTFFPNGSINKFEVAAGTTVEDFAATYIDTKVESVMGFKNLKKLPGGTMTLASGVTSPYIMFSGDSSGYNMQCKGVFLKDGNAIYYMNCANFPFMWDDTIAMVDQILGSIHLVK